ncbi:MAG: exonuclease domain-containing protein [Woeseiaceae bacterium]|nr:exonuclease domain-containing protein [Woeseiaceae bacterium]
MNDDEFYQAEAQPWRRELPRFYYHTHFVEMLAFVKAHYTHVFSDREQAFFDDFDELPFEAQCLYVRLVNRKGRVFARSRLRYPEIGDSGRLLAALDAAGWLARPGAEHVDEVLSFMTRSQLLDALRPRFVGMKTSMKKAELLEFAKAHATASELVELLPTDGVFIQGREAVIRFLLFLYFGRISDGLSRFTMRDLGLVRTSAQAASYEPRFQDRAEAMETYFYACMLADFGRFPERLQQMAHGVDEWPEPQQGYAASLRDKLAYRLGRALERNKETYAALRLYQKGENTRCAERVVRLLLASGQRVEAEQFLERCLTDPASDAEALLAADLYARKFGKKRTSSLTDLLRAADVIDIDEAHSGSPENAAVAYYEQRGIAAYRVENTLWRTFFGLLFWDLLFGKAASGRHSPFESLPGSVQSGRFLAENQDAIAARLALLNKPAALKQALLKTSVSHYGTANGVFRWRQRTLDALHAMIDKAQAKAMRPMLMRFCADYDDARSGYPDLMLIDGDTVRFIEIKTDGDSVRRNQLLRIEQLRSAGFDADVVQVRWILDPEQDYVVVDVETTGGRGEQHRVTELGAVRVRNGEIVDRYQTLLNPQRGIPANITRLTGITPAMVADAPYFSDVADEFATFLEGGIFVAHNVDFDYRFIAQEFGRLGRTFRMPRLCTCASMRKLYPGRKSYSLAALTSDFGIRLDSHHRALCDAEAAAELLLLINEKRLEQLSPAENAVPSVARGGR